MGEIDLNRINPEILVAVLQAARRVDGWDHAPSCPRKSGGKDCSCGLYDLIDAVERLNMALVPPNQD